MVVCLTGPSSYLSNFILPISSLTNAPGADHSRDRISLLWQAELAKVRAQLAVEQSSLKDSNAERESLAQQLDEVSL